MSVDCWAGAGQIAEVIRGGQVSAVEVLADQLDLWVPKTHATWAYAPRRP